MGRIDAAAAAVTVAEPRGSIANHGPRLFVTVSSGGKTPLRMNAPIPGAERKLGCHPTAAIAHALPPLFPQGAPVRRRIPPAKPGPRQSVDCRLN
jgi:hypothetical protein